MGLQWDDVIVIEKGRSSGEPSVITVNCPDKAGLGCDLCRIILEFGLCVTKGDVSTDGRWCYVVLWVLPSTSSLRVDWGSLKKRLLSPCPPCLVPFYLSTTKQSKGSSPPPLYLLKCFCIDRKGLLHDVTKALGELELTIQRVKVMTTPDGGVLDLFFVTDATELLHTKKRQDETCGHLTATLGDSCLSCELQLAGPEYEGQNGLSSLSQEAAKALFSCHLSEEEAGPQVISPDMTKLKKPTVTIDNRLSPAHTLLQIHCADQKGLLYDVMRTLKDLNIQVAHGRFLASVKGYRDMDLLIQHTDGKKVVDSEKQIALCSLLKEEMLHPLRVMIANRGPDTELLVANPVELSGNGRPRVFYDVTCALKMLGICIFSAEIGRHSTSNQQWEVYRFLLDESHEFPLSSSKARSQIVDRVRRTLMGW